ncbi:GIY-YIG nuclease family protein [bacterium]|nr:GIY-YIG nuclease family protein [bacterium]
MYVYILKSKKDESFYIGSTKNVNERLKQHNKGYNVSTKKKIPWVLIRTEKYNDKSLALKREKFLKSGKGREVLKNLCSLRKV